MMLPRRTSHDGASVVSEDDGGEARIALRMAGAGVSSDEVVRSDMVAARIS